MIRRTPRTTLDRSSAASDVYKRQFKKRSISITPDLQLNHVGFLGAAAPAVKGLKDVEFVENVDELEFSSFELEEFEDYDETVHSHTEHSRSVNDFNNEAMSQSNNHSQLSAPLEQFSNEIASLKTSLLQFSEKGLNKEDLDKIHQRIDELRFSMQTNEFELMLNEKLAYGSLTPAMKSKILKIVGFLQKQNFASSEFSSTDFSKQVNSMFTELVETFPQLNLNSDLATKEKKTDLKSDDDFEGFEIDSDQLKVHKLALSISKEKNISYLAAVKEVAGKE